MEQVKLYDTTLRDGMQGEGMSLSAPEKVRVVHALDALGVHFIEAGFPSSNPKEVELFGLLSELELQQATICAFGMTRRRGVAAEDDAALRTLVECFAPVVTLVGKTWALHLDKVTKVSREENLAMIADSVAFCRAEGKRVVYDAEHFFDGYRDDPAYALECLRAAAGAGAENVTLCDTNGSSLPDQVAEAPGRWSRRWTPRSGSASTPTTTPSARSPTHWPRSAPAPGSCRERSTATASAAATPTRLDPARPAAEDGLRRASGGSSRAWPRPRTSSTSWRTCRRDPDAPYVRTQRLRPQGAGCTSTRSLRPADLRAPHDPTAVGNERDVLPPELSGQGDDPQQAEQAGLECDDPAACERSSG